jgi:hypothetical protein
MFGTVYKGLTKEGKWIYFKVPYGETCRNIKTASKYANAEIIEFGTPLCYDTSLLYILYLALFKKL